MLSFEYWFGVHAHILAYHYFKVITEIVLHYQTKECQRGAKRMKGNDTVIDIRESIIFVSPRRTWM